LESDRNNANSPQHYLSAMLRTRSDPRSIAAFRSFEGLAFILACILRRAGWRLNCVRTRISHPAVLARRVPESRRSNSSSNRTTPADTSATYAGMACFLGPLANAPQSASLLAGKIPTKTARGSVCCVITVSLFVPWLEFNPVRSSEPTCHPSKYFRIQP
jgi:hypothetical protein